jgi:hypothetical protein
MASTPTRQLIRAVQHGTDWSKNVPTGRVQDLGPLDDIKELLATPTWSVKSLLDEPKVEATQEISLHDSPSLHIGAATAPEQSEHAHDAATTPQPTHTSTRPRVDDTPITDSTLTHLLRLCALPPPSSPTARASLLHSLRTQVRFVRHLQSVDTSHTTPLVSLRDETPTAQTEQTITLSTLQPWLDAEEAQGRNGTVRRKPANIPTAEAAKRAFARERDQQIIEDALRRSTHDRALEQKFEQLCEAEGVDSEMLEGLDWGESRALAEELFSDPSKRHFTKAELVVVWKERLRRREEWVRKQREAEEKDVFRWTDLKPSGNEEGRRWGGYYVVKRGGKGGKAVAEDGDEPAPESAQSSTPDEPIPAQPVPSRKPKPNYDWQT